MSGNENSGRPAYEPTDDARKNVRILKACGMSHEAIAEVLGISEPTLKKHFFLDLDIATAVVRAELILARYNSAMSGNVSAQNKMIERVEANAAQEKRAPDKEPKLGKKEEQIKAAQQIKGRFAPPEPPKPKAMN